MISVFIYFSRMLYEGNLKSSRLNFDILHFFIFVTFSSRGGSIVILKSNTKFIPSLHSNSDIILEKDKIV